MKQINFNHPGGFPLEQETLERVQTAYRSELFEALKGHLSIKNNKNYIVTPATIDKKGWAIIHQEEKNPKDETGAKILQGILYPIEKATPTQFLKTTRTGTNLTYGTGVLQTAYFDYEAKYITPDEYTNRPVSPQITDALAIYYYDLNDFKIVKDIEAIETILNTIKANIVEIETDVSTNYLPLNGSKPMKGDLDLGPYKLSKLDIREGTTANVRVTDFRLGSNLSRALVNDNTKLTLNAGSDWQNTAIGGNVYLENLNTSSSTKSLLVIDNANQVTKNNTLIDSLINRIIKLETQPATTLPLGMVAIWGKPKPFPEGWEEYVPLRGRMPIGLNINQLEFNQIEKFGGEKSKTLTKENIPPLDLKVPVSYSDNSGGIYTYINATDVNYELDKVYSGVVNSGNTTTAVNILNPYSVVQFIVYTGISSDTTAPTSPTGLHVTNIGTTSVDLSWNASTDNVGINTYLISVNDGTPFEVGNVIQYTVSGLSSNTDYNFYVIAKDAAGNTSGQSNTESAKTKAIVTPTQPILPTEIRARFLTVNSIIIEWSAEPNNVGVIYQILEGDSFLGNYTPLDRTTDTQYIDKNVTKYNRYSYKLRIINAAGDPLSELSGPLDVKAVPEMEDE